MLRILILSLLALQIRTADPIKRGFKLSDFPRTVKVAENVYTYEDFHAGDEKFTTTDMFVVTSDGVVVADGQGSPAETKGLVDAIAKVTPKPIRYVIIASDHGDHTAGNASFPQRPLHRPPELDGDACGCTQRLEAARRSHRGHRGS